MSIPLIELIGCRKTYLSHTFDLSLNEQDMLIISGKNGCGKSTLISLMLGFIKPDVGKVIKRIKKIAYLPEQVHVPHHMVVYDYITDISRLKGVEIDEALLNLLELPLHKSIEKLSKGNLQKVVLYQTLIGNSRLICLDEPFSGLDDLMTERIKNHLLKQNASKATFVIATHRADLFTEPEIRHLKL